VTFVRALYCGSAWPTRSSNIEMSSGTLRKHIKHNGLKILFAPHCDQLLFHTGQS
jgi:hypothetical protein